jgi:hypothetical protein
MQDVLCNKHPMQKMNLVEFSTEGKVAVNGFQCRQCDGVYTLGNDSGYMGWVGAGPLKGRLVPSSGPQLRCPQHESPLSLAAFEFRGDESIREWRCAHGQYREVRRTVGENYLNFSASPALET